MAGKRRLDIRGKVLSHTEVQIVTWRNWIDAFDAIQMQEMFAAAILAHTDGAQIELTVDESIVLSGIVEVMKALVPGQKLHASIRLADYVSPPALFTATAIDLMEAWPELSPNHRLTMICRAYRALTEYRSNFAGGKTHITVVGAMAVANAIGVNLSI